MKFLITMTYGYTGAIFGNGWSASYRSTVRADKVVVAWPEVVGKKIEELEKEAHKVLVAGPDFGNGLPDAGKETLKGLLHIISHSVTQIID